MKSKRGFTLLELLISLGLMTIFLLVLTEIIVTLVNGQLETFATSGVTQEAKFLLSRLAYDIRRADTVSLPLNLGDQENVLSFDTAGQPTTVTLTDGDILYTDASGTTPLNRVGTSITELLFQRIGNAGGKPTLQVKLTVRSETLEHSSTKSAALQTTIGLR